MRLPALAVAGAFAACAPVERPALAEAGVAEILCGMGFAAVPMRTLPTAHHVVEGTIDGRPALFVVDSGAGATVLHRPFADELGLAAASGAIPAEAIGAGGATALSRFAVDEVVLAGTRTSLEHVFAMDLSHVVDALQTVVGETVHGIVGQDVMRAQHAIIDVQQSRLYLRPLEGEPAAGCG